MRNITTTLYQFAELNTAAKTKALAWARENLTDDWWLPTYDDAKAINCEIKGFETDSGAITMRFTGNAIDTALAIRAQHGTTTDTYKAAAAFIAQYDDYHGINGKITLDTAQNPNSVSRDLEIEWEDIELDFLGALSTAYMATLRACLEYVESDAYLVEMM